MQPSRHLIVVGVGVLVAFGNMPSGLSEPPPNQSPSAARTDELQPSTLQETPAKTAAVKPVAPSTLKVVLSKTVPTERITLPALAPEFSKRQAQLSELQLPTAIAQSKKSASPTSKPDAKKPLVVQAAPATAPNLAPDPPVQHNHPHQHSHPHQRNRPCQLQTLVHLDHWVQQRQAMPQTTSTPTPIR